MPTGKLRSFAMTTNDLLDDDLLIKIAAAKRTGYTKEKTDDKSNNILTRLLYVPALFTRDSSQQQ